MPFTSFKSHLEACDDPRVKAFLYADDTTAFCTDRHIEFALLHGRFLLGTINPNELRIVVKQYVEIPGGEVCKSTITSLEKYQHMTRRVFSKWVTTVLDEYDKNGGAVYKRQAVEKYIAHLELCMSEPVGDASGENAYDKWTIESNNAQAFMRSF